VSAPRAVVVGSANIDVVARAPHLPATGETVLGTALSFVPGGKGANQAVAASRLGAQAVLLARDGSDNFAEVVLHFLAREGVDTTGVARHPTTPTGTALVVVDEAGDNTVVVVPGANRTLTEADLEDLHVGPGDVLLAQLELRLEVVVAAVARAAAAGARTVVNLAPPQAVPDELLTLPDVQVVNRSELEFFAGTDDVESGLRRLCHRPEQVVVATLGAGGVAALIDGDILRVPGHAVPVLDTTGAGDCFVGAFAAAFGSWAEVDEAIHFANLAASVSVQRLGAGTGMPYLSDIEGLA